MAKKGEKEEKEENEESKLSSEMQAIIEKMSLDTGSRKEREQADTNKHYIGFDNATLLKNEGANVGKVMYTNGIIGCNALVLTSPKGTYMAHIDVSILDSTSKSDMSNLTEKIIQEFTREIGEAPRVAYVVTTGTPHAGLRAAIEKANIQYNDVHGDQYGIKVGDGRGSTESKMNSTFNRSNQTCTQNNLLPDELQWGVMSTELERASQIRQFSSTQSSRGRGVRSSAPSRADLSENWRSNNSNVSHQFSQIQSQNQQQSLPSIPEQAQAIGNNMRETLRSRGRAQSYPPADISTRGTGRGSRGRGKF